MEPSNLSKLTWAIHRAIRKNDLKHALALVVRNFHLFDETGPLREKVALILATKGRKKEALTILEALARHYANSGQLVRAIAATLQIRKINPDTTELRDHLAALYNIRSPFLDSDGRSPTAIESRGSVILAEPGESEDEHELLARAVELCEDQSGLADQPSDLAHVALLTVLPEATLRRVIDLIEFDVFDEVQPVLEKGSLASDLVWTVSGDLIVKRGTEKDDSSYRIGSSVLLGAASHGPAPVPSDVDVLATASSEILRLPREAIETLASEFADFNNRIATLRRHATCERLLVTHPVFKEMTAEDRLETIEAFSGHRLDRGDVLIRQHVPSPGLFIVLDGTVDIVREDGEWEITIATLSAGDVFGEIGLVADSPAVAGCVMSSPGHVLHLPRTDFEELASAHPELSDYTEMLAAERLADVETTLSANDLAEVD